MRNLLCLHLVLIVCGFGLGCGSAEPEPGWAPVTSSRATLVLEPPVLAVGEVASLELAVVTPPGRILRAPEGPASTSGIAILERGAIDTRRESARWVHRITLRARALEVGSFELATGELELENPEGGVERLPVPPLAVDVVSVLPDHAARSPYGVRRLPMEGFATGAGVVGAFVAGAGIALASVGLLVLARRRIRRSDASELPEAPTRQAFQEAQRALAGAREVAELRPREALDTAAGALRRYADVRFAAKLSSRTVDELESSDPPFLLTTRWTRLLELLVELDVARFPAQVDAAAAPALVERAQAFVAESAPVESR